MNVFIKNERPNGLKILDCVVCNTFVVYGIDLKSHVNGQKHVKNLKELENSWIWKEIRAEKKSLVGLEYLVELVRTPQVEMLHICMLCGFNGKPWDILNHFKSYDHKKKFLQTHFSSYFRFIPDEKRLWSLCDEIDKLKGRLKPMVCFYEEFDKNPLTIWKRIESGKHFQEENCMDLLTILKNQWNPKRKSTDKEEEKSQEIGSNPQETKDDIQKYIGFAQCFEYFKNLTPAELNNIKVSLKLAEEQSSRSLKTVPPTEGLTPHLKSSTVVTNQDLKSGTKVELSPDTNKLQNNHENAMLEPDETSSENDLSITELNILIDSFESLKSKDQKNLITYLQKLEAENPDKFKKLH